MVTTNTPDLGLRKQDKGDTDWHIPLNNNVDDLDDLIPIVDTDANKSNYEGTTDQLFVASDTTKVYLGNGGGFDLLGFILDPDNFTSGEFAKWDGSDFVGDSAGGGGGIDIENSDGSTLVSGANPIQAGTDLDWTDDGDGSATLDYTGSGGGSGTSEVVYAKDQSGTGLDEKVSNALSALDGGEGTILVGPKDDDSSWVWDSNLNIDPTQYSGVEIKILEGTDIDISGLAGWALTVQIPDANFGGRKVRHTVKIRGGEWDASGGTPDGVVRIIDAERIHVDELTVQNLTNGNNDATCVSIECLDNWSEENKVTGCRFGGPGGEPVDRGIDFKPASVTGGTGTESFDGTFISDIRGTVNDFGIRCRGFVQQSTMVRPIFFGDADNCIGYIFDGGGSYTGTVLTSPKFEVTDGTLTGTVAVSDGGTTLAADQPIMQAPQLGGDSETSWGGGDSSYIPMMRTDSDGGLKFRNLNNQILEGGQGLHISRNEILSMPTIKDDLAFFGGYSWNMDITTMNFFDGMTIAGDNGGNERIDLAGATFKGIQEYSDDSNPDNRELYYDTTDGRLEFKDSGGSIHNLG
jgi:hypothetical protein